MPTYLYQCDVCDAHEEKFHAASEEIDRACTFTDGCDGELVRKVNGTGNFLLKGEGWFTSESQDKYHETTNDKHRYVGGKPWE